MIPTLELCSGENEMMSMQKQHIALYGAGRMAAFGKYRVEAQGYEPVCFIDVDESKQGRQLAGLPVISIEDAHRDFGEILLYITPDDKYKIMDYLIQRGISEKRILNFEKYEEYVGCASLETQMIFDQTGLFCCCGPYNNLAKQQPKVMWNEFTSTVDIEAVVTKFVRMRDRLIHQIRNGIESECSGCNQIQKGFFKVEKYVDCLTYGADAPCQIGCIYCQRRNATHDIDYDFKRIIQNFDWKRFIASLEKNSLLRENSAFGFAAGEIAIDPRKDELICLAGKYSIYALTNAVVFDEKLSKFADRYLVSVDAGTRDTYKLVKGVDAFDRVWKNIKEYAKHGIMTVKYIILPENSSKVDMEGFIQNAAKSECHVVVISSDVNKKEPHTEDVIACVSKMLHMARSRNIVSVVDETFTQEEKNKIDAFLKDYI